MRFHHLARLFYDWGWKVKHEHYVEFSDYLKGMLKKNRVMIVQDGDSIKAILMFYLTDDYKSIYKKLPWQIANDSETGSQMYIDKMLCKSFTVKLHRAIKEAINQVYPAVETVVYHRPPADRCVKVNVRSRVNV